MKRRTTFILLWLLMSLYTFSQTTGENSFLIQVKGWYYINITLNSANFSNNFQWQTSIAKPSSAILFSQTDYANENIRNNFIKSNCLIDEKDVKKYSTLANVNYNDILEIPNPYYPKRKNSLLGGIGSIIFSGLQGTY